LSPALVDTNVLVYAYDSTETSKHLRAIELIESLSAAQDLVVSAQVFNELAWVLLRKPRLVGARPELVANILQEVAGSATVLPLSPDLTFSALEAVAREGMSFWDALVWAAAFHHQIPTVYTEDFQHDREVAGVRFLNPFL
jgi:predicted nucleic acid-binding protein